MNDFLFITKDEYLFWFETAGAAFNGLKCRDYTSPTDKQTESFVLWLDQKSNLLRRNQTDRHLPINAPVFAAAQHERWFTCSFED